MLASLMASPTLICPQLQEPTPSRIPAGSGGTWQGLKVSTVKMPGGSWGHLSQAWLGGGCPQGLSAPLDLVLPSPSNCCWGADTSPSRPQIQNLGLFPVHGVLMKITVPVATRGGNRLLMLRDFRTDQVSLPGGR